MSFLSKIVGSGVGELAQGVASAIDTFVETDEERKAAELLLAKVRQEPDKWQAEISKIEAGHRTFWVAGARPFILWVCGVGLLFSFVGNPIIQWITGDPGPVLPTEIMMKLIVGMLGLAGLRTVEKLTGRAK